MRGEEKENREREKNHGLQRGLNLAARLIQRATVLQTPRPRQFRSHILLPLSHRHLLVLIILRLPVAAAATSARHSRSLEINAHSVSQIAIPHTQFLQLVTKLGVPLVNGTNRAFSQHASKCFGWRKRTRSSPIKSFFFLLLLQS